MRLLTFVLSILVVSSVSLGGVVSIHGGGHGVRIGDHVYLLDLVEHGNQQSAHYDPANHLKFDDTTGVNYFLFPRLRPLDGVRLDLVVAKINDVANADPVFATALLKSIHSLTWALTDHPLKLVDADSILETPTVQVALRTGSEVVINRALWNQMDDDNRTALIVHEAVGAISSSGLKTQQSIRTLTANLFTAGFYSSSYEQVASDLAYFPSLAAFSEAVGAGSEMRRDMPVASADRSGLRLKQGDRDGLYTHLPFKEFRMAPLMKTSWAGGALATRTQTEFLNPTTSLKRFDGLCKVAPHQPRLTKVEVGYYTVELTVVVRESGAPEPRFTPKYVYHLRSQLDVGPNGCTPDNVSQIEHMQKWLGDFVSYK